MADDENQIRYLLFLLIKKIRDRRPKSIEILCNQPLKSKRVIGRSVKRLKDLSPI